MNLPMETTILIVIFSQWVLIVYLLRKKSPGQPEGDLSDEKSLSLLSRAIKKAQNIISQAELSGIKIRAQSKVETRKMSEEMAEGIATATSKVEQMLYKSSDRANSQFQDFLNDLQAKSQQQVADYISKLEADLSAGLQTDLAEMRKSIDAYKTAKLAALDANFLEVAQRALETLLDKKITLTDQVDLVNEALDKAKQEKLISP